MLQGQELSLEKDFLGVEVATRSSTKPVGVLADIYDAAFATGIDAVETNILRRQSVQPVRLGHRGSSFSG
jgi:hypothetical protein